nr:MAG TPA: hypothetical protein [Caudoviricetes sp.]
MKNNLRGSLQRFILKLRAVKCPTALIPLKGESYEKVLA